ncbi:phosphotransferase enzyme family protein [Xylariaceae sp. FL1019]|nr:phosphotransferase enzyme family protein [Xylariaceae sp. FL1019]
MSPKTEPMALTDAIITAQVHKKRDVFIASISEQRICKLASSYKNGEHCYFFQPCVRGSFNMCYFVEFDDGVKWVVRVPLEPCLAFGGKSKLETEIATMNFVAERTSIPIPAIVTYRLGEGPEPLSSFLILHYVEGRTLSYEELTSLSDKQRDCLYRSMADVFLQLRRLEFSGAGCLNVDVDGVASVSKMNMSIDINMQELEGLQPSTIQSRFYGQHGSLSSAKEYTAMLLDLADHAFAKGRSSVILNEEHGADALYQLHVFREHAKKWVDPRFEKGPFVLSHGDFELFNLLLNDDMQVVCVLDWEWSRVVPLQFFKPPLWLSVKETVRLAFDVHYLDYLGYFNKFLAILESLEVKKYGNPLLSIEWEKAKRNSGFLVANALESWTDIDWFGFRYLNKQYHGDASGLKERVKAFIEEVPSRKDFIASKYREGLAYTAEKEALKGHED